MKWFVVLMITGSVLFLSSSDNGSSEKHTGDSLESSEMAIDTFNVEEAIKSINEMIAGKENEPAEEVFENIQIMNGFPAGRITMIMQRAFNNSLGVDCTHCHNPDDWSSDEKEEKKITREMWKMVGKINTELLASIPNLKGPQSVVNCTTCHRGDVKPALNLSK